MVPVTELVIKAPAEVGWRAGPLGWSYLDDDGAPPTEPIEGKDQLWTNTASLPYWTVPRHHWSVVRNLQPGRADYQQSGSSDIDAADEEGGYCLYFVMRHPHVLEIRLLGDASSRGELAQLVSDPLAETDPDRGICGAVEWLDIFDMSEAVLNGVRRYAASRDGTDLRETPPPAGPRLPVVRLGTGGGSPDQPGSIVRIRRGRSAGLWLGASTDRTVIAGIQLFMRSAWEGPSSFGSATLTTRSECQQPPRCLSRTDRRGGRVLPVLEPGVA